MSEYEQYTMDTYNDLALQPSQNDPLNSAWTSNNEWSEQEISYLVDYLFHHLSTDPGGSFQPGTYENLVIHLAQRHPDHNRTVEAIQSKFNSLKETVTIIDHYNKVFGNSQKHDNILITPLDREALNSQLKSAQGKALDTLKLYCNNPFPHYRKVKVLMGQLAKDLVIGSHLPTTQLPSQPPQALPGSVHVWSGNTPSFAPSTSSTLKTPPTQLVQSQALPSSSACGFEPECHAFRNHSSMPPLRPSPQSASATPSSMLFSQQHPAFFHASGSQWPGANQTIQMPLEPHPCNDQSSTWSTRGHTAIHDDSSDSSHLFPDIERSSTATLIGAMNYLVSNIRDPYETTKQAVKFVLAECSLSVDEQAILCIYYGKRMTEAATLSPMGSSLRRAVFRKVLDESGATF